MANEIDFGNLDREVKEYFDDINSTADQNAQVDVIIAGFLTDYPNQLWVSESENQRTAIQSLDHEDKHFVANNSFNYFTFHTESPLFSLGICKNVWRISSG